MTWTERIVVTFLLIVMWVMLWMAFTQRFPSANIEALVRPQLSEPMSLIHAIAEVESENYRFAEGACGEAGILQISEIMVDECNRILGRERYTLEDRWSVDKSYKMFNVYTDFWCAKTGDYSEEGRARRWNGGPDGHTQSSTESYWRKVRAVLEGGR